MHRQHQQLSISRIRWGDGSVWIKFSSCGSEEGIISSYGSTYSPGFSIRCGGTTLKYVNLDNPVFEISLVLTGSKEIIYDFSVVYNQKHILILH